ncbi:MAG: RagB/SusD family nutrient uptake outer membrane protein [Cytophagales bacterium]|nr:RagB/SusD family nutrient uptake outer membrane protein [Cytophagales bacterium]
MNNFNKDISVLIIVGLTMTIVSCSDDFLDRPPPSDITPEQYLWEESQLAAYTIKQYEIFPTHSNWTYGTHGFDQHTDNMAHKDYNKRFVPGEWRVPQGGGSWNFTNIYRFNYFLNTVVPRWNAGEIQGNSDLIDHYIGEMYFLRAFEYFKKVQSLGDFPIVKTVLPDEMAALTEASKRAPRSEVVRFIISDLDSSIVLMSEVSPDGKRNRLSKSAAQLFKSRVALYEATWLKYFSGTAFVPNGPGWPGAEKDYNNGYQFQAGSIDAEIDWLLDQAMNAASAVADNISLTENNGILQQSPSESINPYLDMFGNVDLSSYSEVLLWRRYDRGLGLVHNVPKAAAESNYSNGMTKGFVETFLMANGLPIYDPASGYHGDDSISLVRKERDGRLWLFLKEPGQKNLLYNTHLGTHAVPVESIPNLVQPDVALHYTTGYALRKGINYDGIHFDNGQGFTASIVFRAVEAYLNYIEASYEKNGSLDGKAQQYWAAIRKRAGIDPDFNKTIAATDITKEAKGDWGAYSAGVMLSDPVLYNIRRERRCELVAEGFREMDLKRWRAMDQLVTTPYHIEGFKLWGPMQEWYKDDDGNWLITWGWGDPTSIVSPPELSDYVRPYEITGNELVVDGYRWHMAHYLNPIAIQHFLITSENNDVSTSPIYQNPSWPTIPNQGPIGS